MEQKQVEKRAATSAKCYNYNLQHPYSAYAGGLERVVHDVEALAEALVCERLAVHADSLAHFHQMRRPGGIGVE